MIDHKATRAQRGTLLTALASLLLFHALLTICLALPVLLRQRYLAHRLYRTALGQLLHSAWLAVFPILLAALLIWLVGQTLAGRRLQNFLLKIQLQNKRVILLWAGFIWLFFLLCAWLTRLMIFRPLPAQPNVIIFLSDALRRDHLGCYGYSLQTSPNIDSFAKEATRFVNAYAQAPSTKPAVTSIFTSRYPGQEKVIKNEDALGANCVTMAELLREHGYETAAFIENPVIDKPFGFDQGFGLWRSDSRCHGSKGNQFKAKIDQRIHAWLKRQHNNPFFLYIHVIDPHLPYRAPKKFRGLFDPGYDGTVCGNIESIKKLGSANFTANPRELRHLIALYDEEVRYVDQRFGSLLNRLRRLDLLERTVVIFLSDHGEGFLEHGCFTHSYGVYGELINIPLLVRFPGRFPPGLDKRSAQQIDLLPTLIDLLGCGEHGLAMMGRSLLPGRETLPYVFSEQLRNNSKKFTPWIPQIGLLENGWKATLDLLSGNCRLFSPAADPLDRRDLSSSFPDIAARLRLRLNELKKRFSGFTRVKKIKLDQEQIKRLKSLGYL